MHVGRSLISFREKNHIDQGGINQHQVYYMSLFKMLCNVAKVIEKYQRDFSWEGGLEKKDHLLRWEDVTKSRKNRGLDIGRMKERN